MAVAAAKLPRFLRLSTASGTREPSGLPSRPRRVAPPTHGPMDFSLKGRRDLLCCAKSEGALEMPPGMGASTWGSLSLEEQKEILQMYGLGGGEGEAERKKRISSKFSDVLIQQYTAEVKIPEFVEVGKAMQERLMKAICIEAEQQETAMEAMHDSRSTRRLKQQGLCLTALKAKKRGHMFSNFLYDLGPFPETEFHSFQRGDNVVVSSVRQEDGEVLTINGVISDVRPTHVQVACERDASLLLDSHANNTWRLDQKLNDASFLRQKEALQQLPKFRRPDGSVKSAGELYVQAAILGLPCAGDLAELPASWAQDKNWRAAAGTRLGELGGLNDSQRKAIASALTRSLSLWQGPPGTGKTRTLMTFIDVVCGACNVRQEWRKSVGQILVTADTNAAVDNLLEGLLERGLSVVRVGNPAKVRDDLRSATLEALAEGSRRGQTAAMRRARSEELRRNAEEGATAQPPMSKEEQMSLLRAAGDEWRAAEDLMRDATKEQLDAAQVVVCTCSGAGSPMMQGRTFKIVLIDEATQATEPSTLVPLTKGAECCVLAGDPRQLPPTVVSQAAVDAGLSETLFARLEASTTIPVLLLNMQYRMHPAINRFPSAKFYGNKVKSGVPGADRPPPWGFPWPKQECPVALLKCFGKESASSLKGNDGVGGSASSYSNMEEAELAVSVAKSLLAPGDIASVAILTPYNGQVRLLKRLLNEEIPKEAASMVRISSVDGFQGQEADAVVFSTVRSNAKGNIGFVADLRRLNVAITRARRGLVVIGNPRTLASDQHWKSWLGFVHKVGSVLSPADLQ